MTDQELIDKALFENLSSDEQKEFDARMSLPAFLAEWNTRQAMKEVISEKSRHALKKNLQLTESNITSSEQSPNRLWIWVTILGFMIIASWTFYKSQSFVTPSMKATPNLEEDSSLADLYIAYYAPYPNEMDPIVKSESATDMSMYQLYEAGQYNEALTAFIPNLGDENARWYYAQTMLALGDLEAAQDVFISFSAKNDSQFQLHAQWYLALIYLKENELDQAKNLLSLLQASDHKAYSTRSSEILNKLD